MILQLDSWETPATHYPEGRVGDYRLTKGEYACGHYSHYWMDGYAFVEVTKPIPITLLQEYRGGEWCDWMADTPMDFTALSKYAQAASGRVLTSGLGLALVVHELVKNDAVTGITVVERSPEVAELVSPQLPVWVELVMSDFWDFVATDDTDWGMVIVDIWATKGKAQHQQVLWEEVIPASKYLRNKYPKSKLVVHGFADVSDVKVVQPHPRLGAGR